MPDDIFAELAKKALGIKPPTPKIPTLSPDEDYAVRTIIGEASTQGQQGWDAVAGVIKNRATGAGQSYKDIVLAPSQFEPWSHKKTRDYIQGIRPDSPIYQKIAQSVIPVLRGEKPDPTGGATHFYAPKAQAALGRAMPDFDNGKGIDIGDHRFFKLGYSGQGRHGTKKQTPVTPNVDIFTAMAQQGMANPVPLQDDIFTALAQQSLTPSQPEIDDPYAQIGATTQRVQPVTEKTETIEAQIQSANDPNVKTRFGVLATVPEQATLFANQPNFKPFEMKGVGTLWLNTGKIFANKKLKLKNEKDLQQYLKNPKALTTLLGIAEDVGNETRGTAVLAKDPKTGTELATGVVTNPISAVEQAQNYKDQFPNAEIEVTDTDVVTDARKQGEEIDRLAPTSMTGEADDIAPVYPVAPQKPSLPISRSKQPTIAPKGQPKATQQTVTPVSGKMPATPELTEQDYQDYLTAYNLVDTEANRRVLTDLHKANKGFGKDVEVSAEVSTPQVSTQTPPKATPKGVEISFKYNPEDGRTYGEQERDAMASQFAGQLGIDADIVRGYINKKGFAEGSESESDREAQAKAGIPQRRKLDAAAVADLVNLREFTVKKRAEIEKEAQEKLTQYTNELEEGMPTSVARLRTEFDMGGMSEDEFIKRIAEEKELAKNLRSQSLDANELDLSGITSARLGSPNAKVGRDVDLKENNKLIDSILERYPTLTSWKKEQDRLRKEYQYRPLAAPLEFAKGVYGAVPKAVASVLKSADLAMNLNPLVMMKRAYEDGKPFQFKEGVVSDIGNSINKYVESTLNKDFDDSRAIRVISDTMGQALTQVAAGILSGGATVPTALGFTMGASSQFDEANKFKNATDEQKAIAWAVGGLAAVPDAVIFSKGGVGGALDYIKGLTKSLLARFGVQYGEKAAAEMTEIAMKSFAKRFMQEAPKNAAFEVGQEVSENKINNLVAAITYDPSEKRIRDANPLHWNEEDTWSAIGAIVGGGSSAVIQAKVDSIPEIEREDFIDELTAKVDALAKQKSITPEQAAKAKREIVNLKPLVADAPTEKVTEQPVEKAVEKAEKPKFSNKPLKEVVAEGETEYGGVDDFFAVDEPTEPVTDPKAALKAERASLAKLGYTLPVQSKLSAEEKAEIIKDGVRYQKPVKKTAKDNDDKAKGTYPFATLSSINPSNASVTYKNDKGKIVRQEIVANSEAELEQILSDKFGLTRNSTARGRFEVADKPTQSITPTITKGTTVYSKSGVKGTVESVDGNDLGVAWDNNELEVAPTTVDAVSTEKPSGKVKKIVQEPWQMTAADWDALSSSQRTEIHNQWDDNRSANPSHSNYHAIRVISAMKKGLNVPRNVLDGLDKSTRGWDAKKILEKVAAGEIFPQTTIDWAKANVSPKAKSEKSPIVGHVVSYRKQGLSMPQTQVFNTEKEASAFAKQLKTDKTASNITTERYALNEKVSPKAKRETQAPLSLISETQDYTFKNPPPDGLSVSRDGKTGTIQKQDGKIFVVKPDGTKAGWSPTWKPVDETMMQAAKSPDEWYSTLGKALEQKMPARASADQVRGIIKDAKQEEREWLGIDQYLDENPTVTKADILQFIRGNQVQVEEVVKESDSFTLEDAENEAWEKIQNRQIYALEDGAYIERTESGGWFELRHDGRGRKFSDLEGALDTAVQEGLLNVTEKSETKFSQYVLPGGENYKELLLTMPEKRDPVHYEAREVNGKWTVWDTVLDKDAAWAFPDDKRSREVMEAMAAGNNERGKTGRYSTTDNYKSGHWDEPNILAHIRFDDRTVDGKRVLHIAEIQSDWHQAGRKQGYKTTELPTGWTIQETTDGWHIKDETGLFRSHGTTRAAAIKMIDGVPNAPFKKSWQELAFKKILRHAVENGYDAVSWDTGETQAERYDLSKQVKFIQVLNRDIPNAQREVVIYPNDGEAITLQVNQDGKVVEGYKEFIGKSLDDVIGKEMAEKAMKADKRTNNFTGNDLKVGGEGMKGFYDKILPTFVNKYVKKWGGKVERGQVPSGIDTMDQEIRTSVDVDGLYTVETGSDSWTDLTEQEADAKVAELKGGQSPAHIITITPAMRESVMKGQQMFRAVSELDAMQYAFQNAKTLATKTLVEQSNFTKNARIAEGGVIAVDQIPEIELIRRIMGEGTQFYGVMADPNKVAKFNETLDKMIAHSKSPNLRKLKRLVNEAMKHDGTVIFAMSEETVPEEKAHRALYGNRQNNRASQIAPKVQKSIVESDVFKNAKKFQDTYKSFSEAGRVEEFAVKASLGQWNDLGITSEADKFEAMSMADDFYRSYAETNKGKLNPEQILNTLSTEIAYAQEFENYKNQEVRGNEKEDKGTDANIPVEPTKGKESGNDVETSGEGKPDELKLKDGEALASFPKTLRKYGLDAIDVAYTVYGHKESTTKAIELLNKHGIDGSIKFLESVEFTDPAYTVLSGMVYDTLLNQSIDTQNLDIRKKADDFLISISRKLAKAGAIGEAVKVMQHAPVVTILANAESAAEEAGNTLTPEQVKTSTDLGHDLEENFAETQFYKKDNDRLRAELAELKVEMQAILSKQQKKVARSLRSTVARKIKETHKDEIAKAIADANKVIREMQRSDTMMMAAPSDQESLTKILSKVVAGNLVDGLANNTQYLPESAQAELEAIYGAENINPIFQDVYAEAMKLRDKWIKEEAQKRLRRLTENKLTKPEVKAEIEAQLNRELPENLSDKDILDIMGITRDTLRRQRALEQIHRYASGVRKANVTPEVRQTIATIAPDDITALGALLHAEVTSPKDFNKAMAEVSDDTDIFPNGYDQKAVDKAFVDGAEILEEAKTLITEHQLEIKQETAELSARVRDAEIAELNARERLDKTKQDIANHLYKLKHSKARYVAKRVWNILPDTLRNMTLSAEASFLMRQGGKFLRADAITWLPRMLKLMENDTAIRSAQTPIKASFKTIVPKFSIIDKYVKGDIGDDAFARHILSIENDPDFDAAVADGVDFSTAGKIGSGLKLGEEQLQSEGLEILAKWSEKAYAKGNNVSGLLKKIPSGYAKTILRFDKGMSVFLDTLRLKHYKLAARELRSQGLPRKENREEYKELANRINTGTSRPNKFKNIKAAQSFVDGAIQSKVFLAPAYTVAKWQDMGADVRNTAQSVGRAITFQGLPKGTQRIMMKRAMQSYGALVAQYAILAYITGALISFDPDDDDFLKLKWGNYRYDLTQGNRSEIRYIAKLIKHADSPMMALNSTTRYLRSRLNVLPAFATDMWTGKDLSGKTVTPSDPERYAKLFAPLAYMNAIGAYNQDGAKGVLWTLPADVFGYSAAVYPDRVKDLTKQLSDAQKKGDVTEQERLKQELEKQRPIEQKLKQDERLKKQAQKTGKPVVQPQSMPMKKK